MQRTSPFSSPHIQSNFSFYLYFYEVHEQSIYYNEEIQSMMMHHAQMKPGGDHYETPVGIVYTRQPSLLFFLFLFVLYVIFFCISTLTTVEEISIKDTSAPFSSFLFSKKEKMPVGI